MSWEYEWSHWRSMPEFLQQDFEPLHTVVVNTRSPEDYEALQAKLDHRFFNHERYQPSTWFPAAEIGSYAGKRWVNTDPTRALPRYPIYVPTHGRWESRLTLRAFDAIGVPYRAVIEEEEVERYMAAGVPEDKILVQPTHRQGLVVTRNWIWDHAEASGVKRFWTFDDNIREFYRLNRNLKTPVGDGTILRVIEDFADRYANLPICGMNYFMFADRKSVVPPFYGNTRVYSNMLIETCARDPQGRVYRNEGFYNDDTDLCLRVLKDGFPMVLFNAFLILKMTTMRVKGGMTGHYQGDGRLKMAQELQRRHPDVTKMTRKWGRWQHVVDYSPFAGNRLVYREGAEPPAGIDEFGMGLEVNGEMVEDPALYLPGGPLA